MKRDITILMITLLAVLLSCNSDDKGQGNKGKLRIGVTINTSVITKAEETVEADSIRLTVKNMDSGWSKEYAFVTADLTTEEIELASGPYELTAATGSTNNGFAGFDTPYYMGKDTVYIQAEQTTTANIECALTTVKVAVYYDSSVGNVYLKDYKTVVRNESGELSYTKEESRDGFFATGYLSVDFMYQDNTENWQTIHLENIAEAKAREYYKIQISADKNDDNEEGDSEGAANITITVGETNPKDITIGIALPKVTLTTDKIADDKIEYTKATLSGSYLTPSGTTPKTPMFYYREKKEPATTWSEIAAVSTRAATTYNYTAEAINLSAGTEYEYKFMEKGNVVSFTTKELMEVNDATDVDVYTATLNGKYIGKSDAPLFYYKENKEEVAEWKSAPAVLKADNTYEAKISGLMPETNYVFKLMESETKVFTTLEADITLAPAVGTTSAYLYGKLAQSHLGISDYYFEYTTDGTNWVKVPSSAIDKIDNNLYKAVVTGLPTNTNYQYRFMDKGNVVKFMTYKSVSASVSPWAKFVVVTCSFTPAPSVTDSVLIEYEIDRKPVLVVGLKNGEERYFQIKGLTPGTSYDVSLDGQSRNFTTELSQVLYNGSFDDWGTGPGRNIQDKPDTKKKVWYADTQINVDANNSFWDSGNLGASMMSKSPTSPIDHANNGTMVELRSQYVGVNLGFTKIGKFAAGNIYAGQYKGTYTSGAMGAKIHMGRPFTSRPTQLKGWYNYVPKDINYVNGKNESNGQKDKCAIYIALTDVAGFDDRTAFEVNTQDGKYVDFTLNNPDIIAYGSISETESQGTNGGWAEFSVNLHYKDLTRVPKYIVLVASASKDGDYFTGGEGSLMYIDNFELIYGDNPIVVGN